MVGKMSVLHNVVTLSCSRQNIAQCSEIGLDDYRSAYAGLVCGRTMRFGVGPYSGLDQRSYSTPGSVRTGMGDRYGLQLPVQETYFSIQPATQVNSAWPSFRG